MEENGNKMKGKEKGNKRESGGGEGREIGGRKEKKEKRKGGRGRKERRKKEKLDVYMEVPNLKNLESFHFMCEYIKRVHQARIFALVLQLMLIKATLKAFG